MLALIRLLLLMTCFFLPTSAMVVADESPDRYDIDREGEGFLARELRKNRTWPHQDMAYRLLARGDLAGAVQELKAYLEIDPLDDNIRFQLMTLQDTIGDAAGVIKQADHLFLRHPQDPAPLLYRAQALRRQDRPEEARKDLEMALAVPGLTREQRVETVMSLAHMALAAEEHVQVLEALRLLEEDGFNQLPPPGADLLRGLALSGLGEHVRAVESLELAASRALTEKERILALESAAEAAIRLGRYDQARLLLLRLPDRKGLDAGMERRLAELAMRSGQMEEAKAHFYRALELGSIQAHGALAQILLEQGEFEEAANLAEAWVAATEDQSKQTADQPQAQAQAQALALLGNIRERQGDLVGAEAAFAKWAAVAPGPASLMVLARIRAAIGKTEQARQAYEQALELAPTAANRFELGLFLARFGHHAQAVDLLNRALERPRSSEAGQDEELGPDRIATALEQIGHSSAILGRRSEAERAWTMALRHHAGQPRPDLLLALGDNAWNAGQPDRAAEYYQRAWDAGGRRDAGMARRTAAAWVEAGQDEPAIAVYRTLAEDPARDYSSRLAAWESIAEVHRRSGRFSAAARALMQAASLPGVSVEIQAGLLESSAIMMADADEPSSAIQIFHDLLQGLPRGEQRADMLLRLARLEQGQAREGWQERALDFLSLAQSEPDLSAMQLAGLAEAAAGIHELQGDYAQATAALEQAVALDGETSGRMLSLGFLFATLNRHEQARDAFFQAAQLGAGDMAWIGLARSYQRLGQPGLALYSLNRMPLLQVDGPGLDGLPADELFQVLGLLGYVNEELGRPERAAVWYERALDLQQTPEISFRLARSVHALGNDERAAALMDTVNPADLPEDEYLSEIRLRANLSRTFGDLDDAETVYRHALGQPQEHHQEQAQEHPQEQAQNKAQIDDFDPHRAEELWFELGEVLRLKGEHEAAANAFAQASNLRPAPALLIAEGYERLAMDQQEQAQPLLTEASLAEPDYLAVHQDLGYIAMQRGDNDLAVDHFMDAIDNAPLRPVADEGQARAVAEDVRRMRGEVRALSNDLDLDIWLTYTSGKTGTLQNGPSGGLSAPERDVFRTSSGIELGWIPPRWGFQDYRIFKLIGRLGWNFEPGSLDVVDNSWDAALGVRYKPLKHHNLNLGLERIFSLSGEGEDNWVVRVMGSLSDGMDDVHPHETLWNYSFLFGEVDAYLESPSRHSAYVEARQGMSWKLRDDLVLSPFLVADAKWWSRADDVSFYEAGLGLSTRYLYDEDKYQLSRRSVELLMTYKIGRIFDTDNIKDDTINAFFATLLFRF